MKTILLNDGNEIPQFGLGVFEIHGDAPTQAACLQALENGIRHIDTAHAYENERGVGAAIRRSGIPREEIWITTKLWPTEYGQGVTYEAIEKMLERLDTDYIDLLLLHQQVGSYLEAWKDMEKAVDNGLVRSIGLSNFESDRLEEVIQSARILPSVLQVECHPYFQQRPLKERLKPYDIQLECWYPLGHGDPGLLQEPVLVDIAADHGCTPAQVVLAWHLAENHIIFPRTSSPVHMRENLEACSLQLSEGDLEQIRRLDSGKRYFSMPLTTQEVHFPTFHPAD